jgi:hypothetical protein
MEEMSRQNSFQTMACLLLAAIGQVYSENWERKAEQKGLKRFTVLPENKCIQRWGQRSCGCGKD